MGAPSSAAQWRGPDGSAAVPAPRFETPASARILVVEDEHVVGLDLQVRLTRMGHSVVVAHSGEEAIEQVARSPFDLVLMDIRLKGVVDGIEAARRIRGSFDVPIIYLTAYADNHTVERARFTEPYGYILKPFQERELRAAIEIALQRHAQDRIRSAQQRLQRFLAEASVQMAKSLDYQAVARSTAELVVPRYADWCSIHLRERDNVVPAFAFAYPDGHDVGGPPGHLVETVEATGRPELVMVGRDLDVLRDAFGEQHFEPLRALGARSLLCVPLVARQQVLGSLAFVAGRSRPPYGPTEQAAAEDLARGLAIALDNALLYRQAQHAIEMRDEVLAVVSHDLRAPLWAIVMAAEHLIDDPEVRATGKGIARSAERMNRLIGDLLDASAINAGRLALQIGTHRADALVREAIETFRSQAELRQISIDTSAVEPALVSCDRDRVLQVMSNLLGNALRFTPRQGHIEVSARREDGKVRFAVRDSGPGIAPEQLPHLFERFWRSGGRRDGAGLGLFIAKGIVAAHGGTLAVETATGQGSTFHFALDAEG